MQELLPDIRHQLSDIYVFQQDSAPKHRAHETVDLLTKETEMYKKRIIGVDKLHARILTAWG